MLNKLILFYSLIGFFYVYADERLINTLSDTEQKEGFVLLFNGKDFNGWKTQEKEHFRVEEGVLIADGAFAKKTRSMIYYVGKDGKSKLEDFELRLQVFTTDGANSGIYFRTAWQDKGYPDKTGYEAQIANTHKNPRKTGSIYKIVDIAKPPTKDNEWFDYHVIAKGNHIIVKLNGKKIVDHKLTAEEVKKSGGLIGLQCHDPGIVKFRNIRLKKLN